MYVHILENHHCNIIDREWSVFPYINLNRNRNLLKRVGNSTQQFATEIVIILNCCHSCRVATFVGGDNISAL